MEPKLHNIWKPIRKQGFLTIFFNFDGLFNFGSILAHQTSKFEFEEAGTSFDNPGTSGEKFISVLTATVVRGSESASIEIPPFRPYFIKFSKTVSYEVHKSCFTMFTFRGTFTKWILVWKEGFQLMQILGFLGMYFDAAVVTNSLLLFRLALAILCNGSNSTRALFVGRATEAIGMPLCFCNFYY